MESNKPNIAYRWLRAIGFFRGFLLVSFMPVSLGIALAYWHSGELSWPRALMVLLGTWFYHMGANLLNDYYDHVSGTDDINQVRTPYSGGTRVIQENLLPPRAILIVGCAAYVIGFHIFALLTIATGFPILVLAIIGAASGIFYSVKPIWLAYRGFGEVILGLNFGPFLVLTAYYAQAKSFSVAALLGGMILGLFATAIISINEIPDWQADHDSGKRNLLVRYGREFIVRLWAICLWAAMVLIFVGAITPIFPWRTLLALLPFIPIYLITNNSIPETTSLNGVTSRCRGTILIEISTWALLMIALLFSPIKG